MKLELLIISFIITVTMPSHASAQDLPTLTIVNPIRGPQLGLEKADLLSSLKGQWEATKIASISATWLWQYSALENDQLVLFAKQNFSDQEYGIFLEIDKNTAEKSGVDYKGRVAWYHSDGLFLTSYDIFEREKLIDTTFAKFKQTFGYYPKSVGAWWVGAQPISYMKEKYGITAVLQCADQFNTDAYSIWGTPWSIPYIPSKTNSAIPAQNKSDQGGIVMMQWAPRDPLKGYGKGVEDSTFSLQDYQMKGYTIDYFNYLREIYANKKNDQLVFGLESGLPADAYQGQFKLQNLEATKLQSENRAIIQTMEKYAAQFLQTKGILPPTHYFLTKDFNSNDQSFWYNSERYRVGIHKKGKTVSLIDFRTYDSSSEEDFYIVPNTEKLLRIETQSRLDNIRHPGSEMLIGNYEESLHTNQKDNTIILMSSNKILAEFSQNNISIPPARFSYKSTRYTNFLNNIGLIKNQVATIALLKQDILMQKINESAMKMSYSKKEVAKNSLYIYTAIAIITTVIMLFALNQSILGIFATVLILFSTTVFVLNLTEESKRIILAPFENKLIREIKNHNKKIVFLDTIQERPYRAVRPLFYYNPNYIFLLSGKQARIIVRQEKKQFEPKLQKDELLIIPRYLGEELYGEDVERLKLEKVYDIGQIAIYAQK